MKFHFMVSFKFADVSSEEYSGLTGIQDVDITTARETMGLSVWASQGLTKNLLNRLQS